MKESGIKIISSQDMKALELNSSYLGVSALQLMENAGAEVARFVSSRFDPKKAKVMIFAGIGGNGGDGFVAARHLASRDFNTTVVLIGTPDEIKNPTAKTNWDALSKMTRSVRVQISPDSKLIPDPKGEVIIDALLGTGSSGPLRTPILEAVEKINQMKSFLVAVDCPTGLNADSGSVENAAVKADMTITLHRAKSGLIKARKYVGELVEVSIGIPPEAELFAGPGDLYLAAYRRKKTSHKGDNGRLLVVGGSETFIGAPALVATAALRTGIDLAYVATPEKVAHDISSMSPDLITIKLEGKNLSSRALSAIEAALSKVDAVVIGPGLGLEKETVDAVEKIVCMVEDRRIPMLLDADGLKAFANVKRRLKVPLVCTPHMKEYEMLAGTSPPGDIMTKAEHVRKEARKLGAVILLKGPVDIISDGVSVKFNFTGNPGMTVGGTGDTLSGIVGAFLSQGTEPFKAATAGAFVNGVAGDLVAAEKGYHLVASDIVEKIPKAIEGALSCL
jgi:NAD(P)H-hydrate epimerase